MAPTITGLGYDWAIEQTGKALEELIELSWLLRDRQQSSLQAPVAENGSRPDYAHGSADMLWTWRTAASTVWSWTHPTTTT